MDVSVIIVTYNSADCLRDCVASVAAQEGVSKEIIVVDNASADGTPAIAKEVDVRLLANQENIGYGRANNQGFAVSQGRFIYLLNPDTRLTSPDNLARLSAALTANPNWGMAGSRIISTNGGSEEPPPTTYPGERQARRDFGKLPGKIAWVLGASMIIRRELYAALGGFDPGFFLYSEETDFCLRMRELGREIGYVDDVVIVHHGGASEHGRDPYDITRRKMSGLHRFWRKHFSAEDAARLVRRDLYRSRFRMIWHGVKARFQGTASRAWRKHREYRATWETSKKFLAKK